MQIAFLTPPIPHKDEVKIFVEHPSRFLMDNAAFENATRDNALTKMGGNRREAELLAEALKRIGFDEVELSNR